MSTQGAAAILHPRSCDRSPRRGLKSECMTRNQYIPCACAHSSFAPDQPGKAASMACAEPATKSTAPSARALYARSTGKISSTATSMPSWAKNPSSAAAIAGKYELEMTSGTAIFMLGSKRRAPAIPYATWRHPSASYASRGAQNGAEVFPERARAFGRDHNGARALDPTNPVVLETVRAQGGADRSSQMRPALAPIEAGPAQDAS